MELPVNTKFIKLLIVCLVFVVIPSHAAIDNAGVLDNVLARYSAAAYFWAGVFTNNV